MPAISICKFGAYGSQTMADDRLLPIHLVHTIRLFVLYSYTHTHTHIQYFRMNFLDSSDSTRIAFNLPWLYSIWRERIAEEYAEIDDTVQSISDDTGGKSAKGNANALCM